MTLIGMNALVWLAIVVTGWARSELIPRLALLPVGECGSDSQPGSIYNLPSEQLCAAGTNPPGDGLWFPGVSDGAVWQLLTSAFTHVEIWHIGFNMLALWFLGPQLELALGRLRFVALYVVSALAGSVCVYWLSPETSTTLGASGAVFGLMGALLVIGHKVGGDVSTLLMWVLANAVLTFTVPNVSWQGHVGGFVGGALVAAVLAYAPRARRTTLQAAGVGLLVAVLVAATVARTVVLA
jgi:membrane associated rhomboid family serine protease